MTARHDKVHDKVIVRMYDVGFGDACLVLSPTAFGMRKILIDCGAMDRDRLKLNAAVDEILRDVTDADGVPRIDVVISTHRHRDAISGFSNPLWQNVEVREVWMPWTEDPDDPDATSVRRAQNLLAQALSLAADGKAKGDFTVKELARNALSDGVALDMLHHGFKGKPVRRYLGADANGPEFRSPALPGLSVYVMGPGREREIVRDMIPPPGSMALAAAAFSRESSAAPEPFSRNWRATASQYPSHPTRKEREGIGDTGKPPERLVASGLDKAINGTSLMLVFKIGKVHLSFVGDAQWATWRAAMRKIEWRCLLELSVLHKIGHHGSHASTPAQFIDRVVAKNDWCLISTSQIPEWPETPDPHLLTRLLKRTSRIARTDQLAKATQRGFGVRPGVSVEVALDI